MGEKAVNVLPGGGRVEMDKRDARALVESGDGTAALVYLYILTENGAFSPEAAAGKLRCSSMEVRRAMGVLASLRLVEYDSAPFAPAEEEIRLPVYSAAELTRQVRNPEFRALLKEVEGVMGYSLTSDNVMKLLGIYDALGLPAEVILTMVTHCLEESHRKNGPGRRLTMGFVEREAYEWHRMGITTLEQAERYIRAKTQRRREMGELTKVLGIRDRAIAVTERKYMESWLEMGFPPRSVALAYDRTVMATGKLTWKYLDAILRSWKEKGLYTPEQIASGDGSGQRRERSGGSNARDSHPAAASGQSDELDELRKMIDGIG